jgi:hypothetical protein
MKSGDSESSLVRQSFGAKEAEFERSGLYEKLEWTLKQEIMIRTRHFPCIGQGELIEIVETLFWIASVLADTRSEHLPNAKSGNCVYGFPFSNLVSALAHSK